jgi:hypothetical protein
VGVAVADGVDAIGGGEIRIVVCTSADCDRTKTVETRGRVPAVTRIRRQFNRPDNDSGQILMAIVVFAVIVGGLITVVVNATKFYLEQTSLYAAADAAAAKAANQLDYGALIQDNSGWNLPVNEERARAAVVEYAVNAELMTKFHDFRIADVSVSGTTASVTFQARVPMPFVNFISREYRGGVQIAVTSNAELPADRQ